VTTHEHAFVLAAPNHVTRANARPTTGRPPAHVRQKRRSEKGMEQAAPWHTTARQRGQRPQRPNDALRASPRNDHPDAPARRRGHPWPLETSSAVPTDRRPRGLGEGSTTRPQRRTRVPPAAPTVKSPAHSPESRSIVTYDHPRSPGIPYLLSRTAKIPRRGGPLPSRRAWDHSSAVSTSAIRCVES
jgi:hypothetical protein